MNLNNLDLLIRKFELMRIRWGIRNGRIKCCDEATRDGALWWLDQEIDAIEKTSSEARVA